jgi:hypothetical protein
MSEKIYAFVHVREWRGCYVIIKSSIQREVVLCLADWLLCADIALECEANDNTMVHLETTSIQKLIRERMVHAMYVYDKSFSDYFEILCNEHGTKNFLKARKIVLDTLRSDARKAAKKITITQRAKRDLQAIEQGD